MNYEDTKILMTKEMENRNYGRDIRKKCFITLNQICKHSEKYHDTNLLDSSDARIFFDFLHNAKKINPSTINNYRSALKFIYTAVLKKEWDDLSFPHINIYISKIKDIELPKPAATNKQMTYEQAMHKMVIEMELHGLATGTQSSYLRAVRNFILFTGKRDSLLSLTLDDVKSFMHHHMKIQLQTLQTINIKRAAIKFLYVIVYCKKPFKSCTHVIEYLGRYTHRVAISNNRIIRLENDRVTFKWRDYKDNNKHKEMTIPAIEFIRRLLLHIRLRDLRK